MRARAFSRVTSYLVKFNIGSVHVKHSCCCRHSPSRQLVHASSEVHSCRCVLAELKLEVTSRPGGPRPRFWLPAVAICPHCGHSLRSRSDPCRLGGQTVSRRETRPRLFRHASKVGLTAFSQVTSSDWARARVARVALSSHVVAKAPELAPGMLPPIPEKRCAYCNTDDTPLWRHGPFGPKTLCNACGVRDNRRKARVPHDAPADFRLLHA